MKAKTRRRTSAKRPRTQTREPVLRKPVESNHPWPFKAKVVPINLYVETILGIRQEAPGRRFGYEYWYDVNDRRQIEAVSAHLENLVDKHVSVLGVLPPWLVAHWSFDFPDTLGVPHTTFIGRPEDIQSLRQHVDAWNSAWNELRMLVEPPKS